MPGEIITTQFLDQSQKLQYEIKERDGETQDQSYKVKE